MLESMGSTRWCFAARPRVSWRRLTVVCALVGLALAPPASVDGDPSTPAGEAVRLEPGRTVAGELSPGSPDLYDLDLGANTFVLGRVDQVDVDAVIRVLGPEGERLDVFDGSERGADRFQLGAERAGRYRVQVEVLDDEAGSYTITLERVEPMADTPQGKADQHFGRWDRDDTPGVVVGVVDGGELVFTRGYGMANLSHGVPFTPDLRSNVGSISKQFTAMAILLLAEEGRLSLDDPIRKHLPELPAVADPVTIRHVLHHTSGLREIFNTLLLAGWEAEDSLARSEVRGVLETQPELQFPPGSEHLYNNTGYLLLADLVEAVTGEPFDAWMRDHVFAPLGMSSTLVKMRRGQVIPESAQGYVGAGEAGGFREAGDIEQSYGAGGIYSTPSDLTLWLRNFRDATLGGSELVAAMTTPVVLPDGEKTDYGLGIAVDELRGTKRIWHNGGDMAHTAMLVYLPEIEVGVILLGNTPGFAGMGHADFLLESFFADRLPPEPSEDGDDAGTTGEEAGAVVVPAEVLASWAGRWELEGGLVVEVAFADGALTLRIPGQPELALEPVAADTVEVEGVGATLQFHPAEGGPPQEATLRQSAGEVAVTRVGQEAWEPTADELAPFAGRFLSGGLESFWTIEVASAEEGRGPTLVARHRRLADPVELRAKDHDSFTGHPPLVEVRFVRDEAGRVTGFYGSFGRTRDVWFERFEREEEPAEPR